jgi:hypothetical protein
MRKGGEVGMINEDNIRRALEQAQHRKEYNRKRYWERRYGMTLDTSRARKIEIRGVALYKGVHPVALNTVHPVLYFTNGETHTGGNENYWYVRREKNNYHHVIYAEELIEHIDEISPWLWSLVNPEVVANTLSETGTILETARRALLRMAVRGFDNLYFVHAGVLDLTFGQLCERGRDFNPRHANALLHEENVFDAYLQTCDLYQIRGLEDLVLPVRTVIERGREVMATTLKQQQQAQAKARQLRNHIAERFGFVFNEDNRSYVKGPIRIAESAQVYIDGRYVCVTPQDFAQWPTDDLISAKMLTLATDHRDKVCTLEPHLRLLRAVFGRSTGGAN